MDKLKKIDFNILPKWWSVGHTDEWAYKTKDEEINKDT